MRSHTTFHSHSSGMSSAISEDRTTEGRSSKMKKMGILIIAAFLVFSAMLAFAGPWGRGMGPGYGMSPYDASNLGLTPEQSQKIQTLREAYLKDITTPLQNQLFSKKAKLWLLWSEPNPSQEKIMAKQSEINALQLQLQEKATQHQLETRNVLTPEQRAKAANLGPPNGRGPGWKMGGRW